MKDPTTYVYDLEEWKADVQAVVLAYSKPVPGRNPDYEDAHAQEDLLLERFVRDRAWRTGDPFAQALVELLDRPRTRWYA